jgi:osmotically-inducible protein OsmY
LSRSPPRSCGVRSGWSLKSSEINVETFKAVVQLGGFVNSRADINRAVEVARTVPGVTSVKNDMRVK